MAWIEGDLKRTFDVDAPFEEVLEFFSNPEVFQQAFGQMESGEEVEPGTWNWTLVEKNEKGIKFQGKYTVKYDRGDDGMTWETLDGNMKSQGETRVTKTADGKATVDYTEKIATDLPIPRLMAKVFRPIVAREVSRGIGDFLDRGVAILEGKG